MTGTTGERYTIRTVEDVAALTPDQRIRCVADLLRWCELRDSLLAVNAVMAVATPGGTAPVIRVPEQMDWIDDDKNTADVMFSDAETGERVAGPFRLRGGQS